MGLWEALVGSWKAFRRDLGDALGGFEMFRELIGAFGGIGGSLNPFVCLSGAPGSFMETSWKPVSASWGVSWQLLGRSWTRLCCSWGLPGGLLEAFRAS